MKSEPYTPIFTNESNPFAHKSMAQRVPSIIQQTLQRNAFSPLIQDAVQNLHDSLIANARIPMVKSAAPDADMWAKNMALLGGTPWLDTWWFFAEHTVYRMIIDAVRWWETEQDPFLGIKQEELESDRLGTLVGVVTAQDSQSPEEHLHMMLERALWGNRADMSHDAMQYSIDDAKDDELLVDDRQAVVEHLLSGSGTVHIVTDNAGSELTMDLLLADALLQNNIPVMIHPKMHPTFVSDATVADIWIHISALESSWGDASQQVAARLRTAFDNGLLQIFPDFYWNSPAFLFDLPLRLRRTFNGARLVIFKGDANYRRLVNDTIFPSETSFDVVTGHFPAPILAIRTLKSDPVVGLKPGQAEALAAKNPEWRVIGQYGTIQFAPR